jgi:hypothetical protein
MSSSPCVFTFSAPTYLRFDLTPISGATFSYTPTIGTYSGLSFNYRFCSPVPGVECIDGPLSSSFSLDSSNNCQQSFGVSSSASALALADGAGLKLTYANDKTGAFSEFTMRCDPAMPAAQLKVESLDQTLNGQGVAYVLHTAAACGVDAPKEVAPLGVGWIVFLALAGAAVAYFGGGTLYNRRTTGARGLEAVPHIGAFRAVWARFTGRGAGDEGADYEAVGGKDSEWGAPPGIFLGGGGEQLRGAGAGGVL